MKIIKMVVLFILIVGIVYSTYRWYQKRKELKRFDTPKPPSAASGAEAFPSPLPGASIVQNVGTGSASFYVAANAALVAEGGYQDLYNDAGNWTSGKVGVGENVGTNHGITALTYKAYFGKMPTVLDMMNLTQGEALEIYKALFWDKIKGDQLLDQYMANIVFDGQLQHRFNVKLLQQAINNVGLLSYKISEDNKLGPKTLEALNSLIYADVARIYHAYKLRRTQYYYELVDNDIRNETFLNGWLNRINKFNDYELPPAIAIA